jgi:hypothetical protein
MTRGPTLKGKGGKGGRCCESSEGEGGFYKVVLPGVNGDGAKPETAVHRYVVNRCGLICSITTYCGMGSCQLHGEGTLEASSSF